MKPIHLTIFLVSLIVVTATVIGVGRWEAQPQAIPADDPLGDITRAAELLLSMLVGIPAVLSSGLTLLEYFNLITDSDGDRIQMYANTGLYVISLVAVLLGKTDILLLLDRYLNGISPILAAIILFLTGGAYSIIHTARSLQTLRRLAPVREVVRGYRMARPNIEAFNNAEGLIPQIYCM